MSYHTIDTKHYHDLYMRLPHLITAKVDHAYTMATRALDGVGLKLSNLDLAEELIAALTYYVLEANPVLKQELLPAVTGDSPTGRMSNSSPALQNIDDVYP